MPDESFIDPEFVAKLERELNRLGDSLTETRSRVRELEAERSLQQERATRLQEAIKRAHSFLATLTGQDEDDDPLSFTGYSIRPEKNARHALLAVMAHEGIPMAAKDIVAEVQAIWKHSDSAIRSAIVRADADEQIQNIERGVYAITPQAQSIYQRHHPADQEITDDDIPF